MLYTIGYQGIKTANELAQILADRDIQELWDVRSKPYSRNRDFDRQRLQNTLLSFGIRYFWVGDDFGGFGQIRDSAIEALSIKVYVKDLAGINMCLMCMEADPDKCHRKSEIARRLAAHGIEARHLQKPFALAKEDPT